jgi:serine/threonine-protein kinase HipA
MITEGDKKYVARFGSTTDIYNVVKAAFIAMHLARCSGLNVASVKLTRALNREYEEQLNMMHKVKKL